MTFECNNKIVLKGLVVKKNKCIIHVGMHKTGTSSIQETFRKLKSDKIEYFKTASPNHSQFLWTLFMDNPSNHHLYRMRGVSEKDVENIKKKYKKEIICKIKYSENKVMIFSGEGISSFTKEAATRMIDFFKKYFDDICVIAYVRSPVSYLESAFQEVVKGGINTFDLAKNYPRYKYRLEKFDEILGPDKVELIKFSRDHLYKNDVVLDFASRVGADIRESEVVRANEGLSLESIALLYVQRKFGNGYGIYSNSTVDNNSLIEFLKDFGSEKLRFGADIVDPILEQNSRDLEWVENRLGESLRDSIANNRWNINSEKDLISIAKNQVIPFFEFMRLKIPEDKWNIDFAVYCVEYAKMILSVDPGNAICSNVKKDFFEARQLDVLNNEKTKIPDILRELSIALEKNGQYNSARNVIKKALKIRPNGVQIKNIYSRLSE